jgi:uncharacterized repeat protein (TIGR03803 family)
MKSRLHLFVLPMLISALNLMPADRVMAQIFTTLHSFASDGDYAYPYAGLVLSGNTLYGTTVAEGDSGNDTVFAVNTDGTGFTNLHRFVGSNRALLYSGVLLSSNTLYGVAAQGGSSSNGAVFAVNTDGTGFTNLYSFTNGLSSGLAYPYAGLILSGNTLYGTAAGGQVFAVDTDGTSFKILHSFTAGSYDSAGHYTNSDGDYSYAVLLLSGDTLYGTASTGGGSGSGTVFAVKTNGTGFNVIHNFSKASTNPSDVYTNSDGVFPHAGLIVLGNMLYGTAAEGGSSGNGTVFGINISGTGFRILHSFSGSDGDGPWSALILSGNNLYGTTAFGGNSGYGTVFAINTDGTGFTNLFSFTGPSGGIIPYAGLVLSDNTLYGTASDYFSDPNYGTVFSLSFRPKLTIASSGSDVILSWPTNVGGLDCSGFNLQSTKSLISPTEWSTNSVAPVVVNGQKTITAAISSQKKFYRVSQ